jgi:hypothetical protein
MSSSSSSSSSARAVAVARSPREETTYNVKEKMNSEEAADEFIRTFGGDLKMQRLKLLADASASAVDELKQKTSSSEIRSSRQYNLSNIQNFERVKDVDKSAADFINKFRKNLAIERRDSLDRYKQMLDRGV